MQATQRLHTFTFGFYGPENQGKFLIVHFTSMFNQNSTKMWSQIFEKIFRSSCSQTNKPTQKYNITEIITFSASINCRQMNTPTDFFNYLEHTILNNFRTTLNFLAYFRDLWWMQTRTGSSTLCFKMWPCHVLRSQLRSAMYKELPTMSWKVRKQVPS